MDNRGVWYIWVKMKTIKLLLACIVTFGISYFYLSYYRNAFYDLTADEGYIIYGAKRVLEGQILYKDFFQFHVPGDFYLLALMYKLFGYSFIVARETTVIIDSLINTLLFYLSYKAIKSWYAVLPPLFFLILGFPNWMQYSHYWSSMLFLFVSLVFFLNYLEQYKNAYLCLTGFFIGITGLFLQTTGAYSALLILLVLILEKRKEKGFAKQLILFLTSISIPLIIAFGYIAFQGAFVDLIKEQYFMSKVYAEAGTFNPVTLYLKYFIYPYSVIFLLFIGIAILCAIALIFFRDKLSNPVKIILVGDIILFLNSSTRIDFDHILVNSAIVFVIVLLPVSWFLNFIKDKSKLLYKGSSVVWNLVAVSLVLWGIVSIKININNIKTHAIHLNFNGTQVWTFNEKQAWEIKEFFPKVEEDIHGEKNVFVYPYCPLIYVFMNLNNPLSYDAVQSVDAPNYGRYSCYTIVQELIINKVNYIIYCNWPEHYTQMLLALNKRQYKKNVLDLFVENNYFPLFRINNLILYKRR
jgi:hypothetical protein